MSNSLPSSPARDRVHCFEQAQAEVNRLDSKGKGAGDAEVYRQYQRRNSFGLDPAMKIYRIFQAHYYQNDVNDGCRFALEQSDRVCRIIPTKDDAVDTLTPPTLY
nr:hypothetical protein [Burkholderia anthina]